MARTAGWARRSILPNEAIGRLGRRCWPLYGCPVSAMNVDSTASRAGRRGAEGGMLFYKTKPLGWGLRMGAISDGRFQISNKERGKPRMDTHRHEWEIRRSEVLRNEAIEGAKPALPHAPSHPSRRCGENRFYCPQQAGRARRVGDGTEGVMGRILPNEAIGDQAALAPRPVSAVPPPALPGLIRVQSCPFVVSPLSEWPFPAASRRLSL